jgi:hypothetical protein
MAVTRGIMLTINSQDEDWDITDPDDIEKGWSRFTLYFSSRDAICSYFLNIFMKGGGNMYHNEIEYELKVKAVGVNLVAMTPAKAALIQKEYDLFISRVTYIEMNLAYNISPTLYITATPLVIHN